MSLDSGNHGPPPIALFSCALFKPGHQVHFVQAKRGWEADPATYRTGAALSLEDDGWLTVEFEEVAERLWNHDADRLRWCLRRADGRVGLTRYGLLHVPPEDGRFCFSVAKDGPSPCAGPPPPDADPVERIRTHGGFLLPSGEVQRLLAHAA